MRIISGVVGLLLQAVHDLCRYPRIQHDCLKDRHVASSGPPSIRMTSHIVKSCRRQPWTAMISCLHFYASLVA